MIMAPSRRTKKKAGAAASASASAAGTSTASATGAAGAAAGASGAAAGAAGPVEGAEGADVAVAGEGGREDEDKGEERCPACKEGATSEVAGEKETWIQCDACRTWFHWNCAGHGGDAQQVDKWFVYPHHLSSLSLRFYLSFSAFQVLRGVHGGEPVPDGHVQTRTDAQVVSQE